MTPNQNPPSGQRFSHIYISHPELLADSIRMRRRIGALLHRFGPQSLYLYLNRELGTRLSNQGSANEYYWPDAMEHVELRDVLDAVTVIAKMPATQKDVFIREVRRVFLEEKVRYSVDEAGGVHFTVDVQFEQARVSAIRALAGSRYESVRQHFESAYAALDGIPPDPKTALRNTFFAVEGLFRLMFPGAHQLSGGELGKHLKPTLDRAYDKQRPALHVAQKQLAQLVDWVDGAHFYRHEPGTEEPSQPPLEMSLQFVASGAAWLRWLANFDMGRS